MESSSTYFSGFSLNDLWYLGEAALRTLWISVLAISIGSVIGIFLGLALSVSRVVAFTLGTILDIFRSVPLIIQLVFFFNFLIFFYLFGCHFSPKLRQSVRKRQRRRARPWDPYVPHLYRGRASPW